MKVMVDGFNNIVFVWDNAITIFWMKENWKVSSFSFSVFNIKISMFNIDWENEKKKEIKQILKQHTTYKRKRKKERKKKKRELKKKIKKNKKKRVFFYSYFYFFLSFRFCFCFFFFFCFCFFCFCCCSEFKEETVYSKKGVRWLKKKECRLLECSLVMWYVMMLFSCCCWTTTIK